MREEVSTPHSKGWHHYSIHNGEQSHERCRCTRGSGFREHTEPSEVECVEVDPEEDTEQIAAECQGSNSVKSTLVVQEGKEEEDAAEVVPGDLGNCEESLEKAEVEGGLEVGSAEREGNLETLTIDGINELQQQPLLAKYTGTDPTLEHVRTYRKRDIMTRTGLYIEPDWEGQVNLFMDGQ